VRRSWRLEPGSSRHRDIRCAPGTAESYNVICVAVSAYRRWGRDSTHKTEAGSSELCSRSLGAYPLAQRAPKSAITGVLETSMKRFAPRSRASLNASMRATSSQRSWLVAACFSVLDAYAALRSRRRSVNGRTCPALKASPCAPHRPSSSSSSASRGTGRAGD